MAKYYNRQAPLAGGAMAPPPPQSSSTSIVFWICLFVGCTAVPMALDLLRIFLPRRMASGRLVEQWQRPLLLAMVACLCVWAYSAFFPIVRYTCEPYSSSWLFHLAAISLLWFNTVWNYCLCAAVDPGYVAAAAMTSTSGTCVHDQATTPPEATEAASVTASGAQAGANAASPFPDGTQLCRVCDKRVLHFDHHCPFTGGCIGAYNLSFFCLFVLHCFVGCGWACALAWPPFRDCVLRQMQMPTLGMVRIAPPDEAKCVVLGARSLLVLPAVALCVSLGLLGSFHLLLLRRGLTTLQFARRWRREGPRVVCDLLVGHGQPETDKWRLVFGHAGAGKSLAEGRRSYGGASVDQTAGAYGALWVMRVLLLPSMPRRRKLGPGVGSNRSWLGAATTLAALFLLLPIATGALEGAAAGMRSIFAGAAEGLATAQQNHMAL